MLWFIIDKELLGYELFVGAVYIPPQYSHYATDNPFELIESDIIQLNVNDSNMCLAGDFNSRTKCNTDFMPFDDSLFEDAINNDVITRSLQEHWFNYSNLLDLGFDVNRYSMDGKQNHYGKELLDLCKTADIHIVNSRLHEDYKIGKFTCKERSVVDYVICSSEIFANISHFCVDDFCILYSDAHNPISFSIEMYKNVNACK